jgi:hypothetical protein
MMKIMVSYHHRAIMLAYSNINTSHHSKSWIEK